MNQTSSHLPVMEREFSFSQFSAPQEGSSHYDELLMQQSLVFADSLKDLKNLREQLYAAAEYFEQSYEKNEHKLLVVDNLKDYSVKSVINTIDHLGSMAYKVETLLDERIGKIPGIELRVSCLEQRIQTCQSFIDRKGASQQSLIIDTPKYHKRYTIPDLDFLPSQKRTAQELQSCSLYEGNDLLQHCNDSNYTKVTAKFDQKRTPPPLLRKRPSSSPLSQSSASPVPFSFLRIASKRDIEKQRVSPQQFPLMRTGSLVSTMPNPISARRGVSTNVVSGFPQYFPNPLRSVSVVARGEQDRARKEMQQRASKSKRIFKALMSMRRPKKDSTLVHTYYLDYK